MPRSVHHICRHLNFFRKSLDSIEAERLLIDSLERGLCVLFCCLALLVTWSIAVLFYPVHVSSVLQHAQVLQTSPRPTRRISGITTNLSGHSLVIVPSGSKKVLAAISEAHSLSKSRSLVGEVPLELWKIIFQFVAAETPLMKSQESFKLAAVSKYWRRTVLSSAELWDVIAISLDGQVKSRLIRFLLSRSSSQPLHIYISHRVAYPQLLRSPMEEECVRFRQALSVLSPHIGRVVSFQAEASCAYVVGHAVGQFSGVASSLKELSLICHLSQRAGHTTGEDQGTPRLYTSTNWLLNFQAPQLQNLTLTVACVGLPRTLSALPMVRSLTLLFDIDDDVSVDIGLLLNALASLKSLTFLKLDGSSGPAANPQFPVLFQPNAIHRLPSLRVLCLKTTPDDVLLHLLTHATFPTLEYLDITKLSYSLSLPRAFAHLDSSDTAPVLHSFRLGQFGPGVLPAIYPHLRFCRTFVLHGAGALDDDQLSYLSAPHGLTGTWFCHNVIALEVSGAPLISVRALRRLVSARKRPHASGPVAALQTLTVFHRGRLAARDCAWFKAQVCTFGWYSDHHID